jgi:hypothetical protein
VPCRRADTVSHGTAVSVEDMFNMSSFSILSTDSDTASFSSRHS